MRRFGCSMIVLLLASAACSTDDFGVVEQNGESFNGESLNGESLNGESLNGESLNGESLNGESLNGESLNGNSLAGESRYINLAGIVVDGVALDDASVAAGVLSGTRDGVALTGTALVGAQLSAVRTDGATIAMRIVSVTGLEYGVEYRGSDNAWYPICRDATTHAAAPALALAGTWNHAIGPTGGAHVDDPTKFTFACAGSSLGKCVHLGYAPWGAASDGTPLADYHQACVRMLRADYCGDGRSYTTNGRLVNLYDDLGIQLDVDDFLPEAEWTASGSRCMTTHRRNTNDIPCFDATLADDCGNVDHFTSGTLIIDEIP